VCNLRVWGPETDRGTVSPFKYSFALARKRITNGGWTRQVTVRELPNSQAMAGVEMRLTAGGVREIALARGGGMGDHALRHRAHYGNRSAVSARVR
jgi:hypothetical protein